MSDRALKLWAMVIITLICISVSMPGFWDPGPEISQPYCSHWC
jgi:hypothetical protein